MSRHKNKKNKRNKNKQKGEQKKSMTAFVVTTEVPYLFKRVSPAAREISSMKAIRFYYRGADDVVFMKKTGMGSYSVYIPPACEVNPSEISTKLNGCSQVIQEEMDDLKVVSLEWFMFDTDTKKILRPQSFIDFIPAYSIKKALFMPEGSKMVYSLNDDLDYTALQAASLFIAKRETIKPKKGEMWGSAGKALVNFIVSKMYNKPGRFMSLSGSWDHVVYNFDNDDMEPYLKLNTVNTKRVCELAAKIDLSDKEKTTPVTEKVQRSHVLLSEMLSLGVDTYIKGSKGLYEVEIDQMQNVFKDMRVNCSTGVVLAKLQPSCQYTIDELEDALVARRLTFVDEESLRILKRNDQMYNRGGSFK